MQLTPQQDQARKKAIEQALGQTLPPAAPAAGPQAGFTPTPATPAAPTLFPTPNATGTAAQNQQPTPVKPMSMDTPGYGAPSSDPGEAYLQQHPMAGGSPPTPFTPETGRHALLRGIFAGMSEFGRPGAGFAQNAAWDKSQEEKEAASRNWPMQRQKNIDTAMDEQQKRELVGAQTKAANATATKAGTLTTDELAAKLIADAQKTGDQRQIDKAFEMAERLKSAGKDPLTGADPFKLFVTEYQRSHGGQLPTLADWQAQQSKTAREGSIKPEIVAQIGAQPDPRNYPLGDKDPAYTKAAAKWGADYQAKLEHEGAAVADARGAAYGNYRPVQVVDPADGQLKWMFAREAIGTGAAPAQLGAQSMSKEAQMAEIKFASQQAREAVNALPPLDAASIATLTMAMRESDPTVFARLKDTLLGSKQMTPEQQAFVTWIMQLNERAMSLRNIAGMGQGAQDLRAAIQDTLPGIKSGNKEMMLKQLDAFDNQVRMLEQGIPKINHPGAPGGIPAKGAFVWDPSGARFTADGTHPLPAGWSMTEPEAPGSAPPAAPAAAAPEGEQQPTADVSLDLGPAPPGAKEGDTGTFNGKRAQVVNGRLIGK